MKIIIIVVLILLINSSSTSENFTNAEIKTRAVELFKNKNQFLPGAKYTPIKSKMQWIDPVTYNDIYKLSLKGDMTISNLENTLRNSIK